MPRPKGRGKKTSYAASPGARNPIGPARPAPTPMPIPSAPTLPDPAPVFNPLDAPARPADFQQALMTNTDATLPGGCYVLKYQPAGVTNLHYDGTLRVERRAAFNYLASGDLYLHGSTMPPGEPSPAAGIPAYPIARYRYYIRVIAIRFFPFDNSVRPTFELHRFNAATKTWTNEGELVAILTRRPAPTGFPFPDDYLEGTVFRPNGTIAGSLTMGLISNSLRHAVIEIDRVAGSEAPLDNGDGVNWRAIGAQVGWDLTVIESDSDVVEPSGNSWSDAEMHAAMLDRRDSADLDSQWRYHVLAVKNIDSTPRGIMYDAFGTDSNNVPREGIGIATHWIIPNGDPWGLVKGLRFGTAKKPFFRTAIHEIGHAMGLYHNTVDNGVMNTTDVIAASAPASNPFPGNIQWSHATDDQKRLRHMPDIYVRPGGLSFGTAYNTVPVSPGDQVEDSVPLKMTVEPLLKSVPIGAPVRVNIELANVSTAPVKAPAKLGMRSGFVRGNVTDPAGTIRTFSPLVLCMDEESVQALAPGASIRDAITLIRGADGALFPSSGLYRVTVEAAWDADGVSHRAAGATTLMVTPPEDDAHSVAAGEILSSPDTLLAMVIGGDHLEEGISAIAAGLGNKALRPHFAYLEAKRVSEPFRGRKADLKTFADLINENPVMSSAEVERAAKIVQKQGGAQAKSITPVLKSKIEAMDSGGPVAKLVKSL